MGGVGVTLRGLRDSYVDAGQVRGTGEEDVSDVDYALTLGAEEERGDVLAFLRREVKRLILLGTEEADIRAHAVGQVADRIERRDHQPPATENATTELDELERLRKLLAFVVNDLMPVVEMLPEAQDTTTELYVLRHQAEMLVADLLPVAAPSEGSGQ